MRREQESDCWERLQPHRSSEREPNEHRSNELKIKQIQRARQISSSINQHVANSCTEHPQTILLLTEEISQVKNVHLRWHLGIVVSLPDPPGINVGLFCAVRGGRPKRENIASRLRADRCPTLIETGSGGGLVQDCRWRLLIHRRFARGKSLAIFFPSTV